MNQPILERLRSSALRKSELFFLSVEVSHACDLDCQHCFLASHRPPGFSNTSLLIRALREAAALGANHVLLTGGEFTLHPDWRAILVEARQLFLFIQVFTHAGHIQPEDAAFLRAQGVYDVSVSLYSADPSLHDAVTKRTGSWTRTVQGINTLLEAGLHVTIKASFLKGVNEDSAVGLLDWVQQLRPQEKIRVQLNGVYCQRDNGDRSPQAFNLESEKLAELYQHEANLAPGAERGDEQGCAVIDLEAAATCSAGRTALHVAPDGQVRRCLVDFGAVIGDLKKESFAEIWKRQLRAVEQKSEPRYADFKECIQCKLRDSCGICMAYARQEHGKPDSWSHLSCLQTYSRLVAENDKRVISEPYVPIGLRDTGFKKT